jgi:putative NADH-flavin reductase
MATMKTYLVFGATGQTGKHFVEIALSQGHHVRAVARNPAKIENQNKNLEVFQGAIDDDLDFDALLLGVDFVVAMIGDRETQKTRLVCTEFVKRLVPAMRQNGIKRFLFQAGAFSTPANKRLSPIMLALKHTVGRAFLGQHKDNAAVMRYLADEAKDIEWIVHRAAINSDSASKGKLVRSRGKLSVATFVDTAEYNLRILNDDSAIHTSDVSVYKS